MSGKYKTNPAEDRRDHCFLPTKYSDFYDLLYFPSDCHIVSSPPKPVAITQVQAINIVTKYKPQYNKVSPEARDRIQ